MELTDQELEELEGYYHQTLLPENMQKVTENMQKDNAYAKEASSFLNTLGMLEAGKYRTQAQYLMAEGPSNLRVSWFKRPWAAIAAAAAVLLIVVGVWWMRQEDKVEDGTNHNELDITNLPPAPRYTEHYPREGYLMGSETAKSTQRDKAFAVYELGYYSEAAEMFNVLLKEKPDNSELKLYLSVCYLALNRYEDANKMLNAIDTSQFAQHLNAYPWYRAMAAKGIRDTTAFEYWLKRSSQSSIRSIQIKSDSILKNKKK